MPAAAVSTLRCLVVDDHPVVRQGIRALLERELDGVEVSTADSPAAAVRDSGGTSPDVVVIDLRRVSGEVQGTITSLQESLGSPIVVFTADGGPRMLSEALEAPASTPRIWNCPSLAGRQLVEKLPSRATATEAADSQGPAPCLVSSVTVCPAALWSVPATFSAWPRNAVWRALSANAGSTGPSAAGVGGAVPPLPARAAAGSARATLESASASPPVGIRRFISYWLRRRGELSGSRELR